MSNREILFRGKNKKGEWIEGYLSWDNKISYKNTNVCAGQAYFDGTDFYTIESCVINLKTLGQFTGLTDVNGTKIFEGDICHHAETNEVIVIEWHPLTGYVWTRRDKEDTLYGCGSFYDVAHKIRIIGNIHDNPELLEESEQE